MHAVLQSNSYTLFLSHLDVLDLDHGHNQRPVLGPKVCWNRSAGPGLSRLTTRKPRFVDTASIMVANVHIPSGRLLVSYQSLTFHMALSAGAGQHNCDASPDQSVIRSRWHCCKSKGLP